ncbi:MAG: hypothetical protein U1G05_11745 [Kiritimatiellia bacterium]
MGHGRRTDRKRTRRGRYRAGRVFHARSASRPRRTITTRGYAINTNGTGYSPDGEFYTEPSSQASNAKILSLKATSFTVSWTKGADCAGSIVVIRAAGPVNSDPVDGIPHTAGSTFGTGAQLGTGNFVVYSGAGTSVPVTGLTPNTLYSVAVYGYVGSAGAINYRQNAPAATGTTTTWNGHNGVNNISTCNTCHFLHNGSTVAKGAEQEAMCKTCHNPTGAAKTMAKVSMHSITGSPNPIDCGTCHDVHNGSGTLSAITGFNSHSGVTAPNLSYFRVTTNTVPGSVQGVLHASPGDLAFTTGDRNGACQACHQNTDYHRNNGTGDYTHFAGQDCTACHLHGDGFKPTGGCTICHATAQDNSDGAPTRRAVVGEFALTAHHVKGGAVTDDDCKVCHYEGIDMAYHKNNMVDLRDPDNGTNRISFVSFTRNTASDVLETWVTDVQDKFCMHCHDADGATSTAFNTPLRPFSSNTKDSMNVFTQMNPSNPYHHAVRAPGTNAYCAPSATNTNKITMQPPWNQTATHE